jgi:hypothetical protein
MFIQQSILSPTNLYWSGISPHVSQMSKVYMQVLILQQPCTTIGMPEDSETRKWGSQAEGTLYYNRNAGRLGNPEMGVLGQGDLVLQSECRKTRKPGNGGPRPRGPVLLGTFTSRYNRGGSICSTLARCSGHCKPKKHITPDTKFVDCPFIYQISWFWRVGGFSVGQKGRAKSTIFAPDLPGATVLRKCRIFFNLGTRP